MAINNFERELLNRIWGELMKLIGYGPIISLGDIIFDEQSETTSNIGDGEGIFKDNVDNTNRLKTLKQGQNITLTANANDITINAVQNSYGNHVIPVDGSRAAVLAAINSLESAKGTVHIVESTTIDDANLIIPANVHLVFEPTAKFIGSNDRKIFVDGTLQAPPHQIFQGFGTSDVVLRGAIDQIYPQWFGAKGDGVTDDTAAIQSSINAAKVELSIQSKTVYFLPGNYLVVGTINITGTGVILAGEHWRKVTITHSPTVPATDCVVFAYATPYGHGNAFNGILIESTTANSRRLLSLVNQHTFDAHTFYLSGGGVAAAGIYLNYLVNCSFRDFRLTDFSGTNKAIESSPDSSTTTRFNRGYIGSNYLGALLTNSTYDFKDVIFESNTYAGIQLENAGIVLTTCHFEDNANGAVWVGEAGGNISSYRSAYLSGVLGPPVAQIDIKLGRFSSHGDSWSGSVPLVRVNRGGVKQLNTEAYIESLNIPFNFPDAVEIMRDDSGVIVDTPSWKDHSSFYGQFCGAAPIVKETAAYLPGGVSTILILGYGGTRWLLGGSVTVDEPRKSDGINPTTETLHGKRFQFVFEQGIGGGKTVTFNPTYYKLLQSVPDGGAATVGQRLSVWFKYESETDLWYQDSPFLGWG